MVQLDFRAPLNRSKVALLADRITEYHMAP